MIIAFRITAALALLTAAGATLADTRECVMLSAIDGSMNYVSDAAECGHATSPASTFKLPHALIALHTGVIADPLAVVPWDSSDYANASWKQAHSLDSAIAHSVLPFFMRTARAIGRERMLAGLARLQYAEDSFEGEIADFWRNGDLVVTPEEQLDFLRRLAFSALPMDLDHLNAVKRAFLMPGGQVTLAAGAFPFPLAWPRLREVHAKTGNASVDGEYVSWLVGWFDVEGPMRYLFVSRVRSDEALMATAGADLAARVLNEQAAAAR